MPRPSTPCATRWRRHSTTCSLAAPALTCSTARASLAAAPAVAALIGAELGWDADEIARQVASYRRICESEQRRVSRHRDRTALRSCVIASTRHAPAMTTPTPPIELTGSGQRLAGDVTRASAVAARPAGVRSARRSPTPNRWPKRVATGGRSRCTGRSPAWSRAWPARSCRPTTTTEVAAILAACDEARIPVTAAGGRSGVSRGVGADLRRCRARHDRARRHRRGRRRIGCRRGGRRHVRARPRERSCRPNTASPSATSRRASTWRRWAAGWHAGAPVSTRRATARSRTWSSASRSCSPTAPSSAPGAARPAPSGPISTSSSRDRRARSASSRGSGCAPTPSPAAERRAAYSVADVRCRGRGVPDDAPPRCDTGGAAAVRRAGGGTRAGR